MSYFDVYKIRVKKNDGNYNSIVDSTKRYVQSNIDNGMFSDRVKVDGVETNAIVTHEQKSHEKTILIKPEVVAAIGSIVEIKDKKYLALDFKNEGIYSIYPTLNVQLLNASITIETEPIVTERDKYGRPISSNESTPKSFVCIADKSLVYGSADLDNAVNLPDNKIKVIIPYTTEEFAEFTLYGELYYVRDIDLTQVIDNKGLVTITGERKVD